MGIMVKCVRIENYRSLVNVNVELGMSNILIGQNNSGKTNFLKAIDIALNGSRTVSADDIYIAEKEQLNTNKKAIIDILIIPVNEKNERVSSFSDFWAGVYGDKWIVTDETSGDYIGIRTIIEYDIRRDDYMISRLPILEWNDTLQNSKFGKKQQLSMDVLDYVNSFFMDAQRDASADIKNKKSYFGKATSQGDLSTELINSLEKQLNDVNSEIINNIPSIKQTSSKIEAIGKTLGDENSSVKIEPLTRKLTDLHKGMDVTFKDGTAASFSIIQHGMGTRSWISFLTLGAYVDWYSKKIKKEDSESENYVILTMEEPEAHLHPQAQRQLYAQITGFQGQKIVSTHSPNILAQADLKDILHFYKRNGVTSITRFNADQYKEEDINKINREVIKTRGELLFSSAIVLCEGITEELALPIYFKEYFGTEAIYKGINIIGVDGQNYKTFLNLIKDFNIKWYIFSDGEDIPKKAIRNAIKVITDEDMKSLKNVVILENGEDFEKHLIKSGYGQEIIKAINLVEGKDDFFQKYVEKIEHSSHSKPRRVKTNKPPCPTCGQDIYEDIIEKSTNEMDEHNRFIYSCCTAKKAKAKYATAVAEQIVKNTNVEKRIPPKIKDLFKELAIQQHLEIRSEYNEA